MRSSSGKPGDPQVRGMDTVSIGDRRIGQGQPVFIIAEIGFNFTTFEEAVRLIDHGKAAGTDAVKIQTFRADTLATRRAMFDMENTGRVPQHDLFLKYQIDASLHQRIFDYAASREVMIFSTPSHQEDVTLLESLHVPAYKIGSDDAANLPLLRYIARKGKPVILSTGMCTMEEVREAVAAIHESGNRQLILLHCVSSYPARPEEVNLRAMETMAREFGVPTGYSDHTIGNEVCLAAVAMGARMIEKHVTLDKGADGPDHRLSADPSDLAALVRSVRRIEAALGDGVKRPSRSELGPRQQNRKSIVTVQPIPQGTPLTREMLEIKRPGTGIPPKYLDAVVGKVARVEIPSDESVTWEMLA